MNSLSIRIQARLPAPTAPAVRAAEASAITRNGDSDSLFVLGDEGDYVVDGNKQGVELGSMNLFGFDDTEGLTHVGNGRFVITDERLQDACLFTCQAGGAVGRSTLPSLSVGPTVGNAGIEGLSYDPLTGRFIMVKEKTLQAVYDATLDFAGNTASVAELVPPANPFAQIFGTADLSDVQVLTTVQSLRGTADQNNLLIYSQESSRLLEVSRSGRILSQSDFCAIAGDAERATIDGNGILFIAGAPPSVHAGSRPGTRRLGAADGRSRPDRLHDPSPRLIVSRAGKRRPLAGVFRRPASPRTVGPACHQSGFARLR